ncbi:uncharacterized protein LOC128226383 [Mya arenaria]|uniref:uncharacterized protein LOC128226383 n=1 Tax=Mya arenaria TaxID=6604 RepID=UPI0022E332D7|nr:uncharacterized protein LOC128226383 [Mya arenaria]
MGSEFIRDIAKFLDFRKETIETLTDIYNEMQAAGKNYKKTNVLTKTLSVVSGVTSVGLTVAAPFTAGATGVPAALLATVSGVGSGASLAATVVQAISEKGLMKKAKEILAKDKTALQRMKNTVVLLKDLQSSASSTSKFLSKAAELGVATTQEMHSILQNPNTAKAMVAMTKVKEIVDKVNNVLKIATPVINIITIPVGVWEIIGDLKDCDAGKYSAKASELKTTIDELQTEYNTANDMYEALKM